MGAEENPPTTSSEEDLAKKDPVPIFGSAWGEGVSGDAHTSAYEGDLVLLESLIYTPEDANIKDDQDTTPLHHAAYGGFLDCVQFLVESGCDIDHRDVNGFTALQIAVFQGHLPVVQFLSEAGADVNLPDENLSCGVHKATLYDQHECLLVLLRYNADPDVKTSRGWTALHLAAECGHVSCVDALISHKANVNAVSKEGSTPLHKAAIQGHEQCVAALLKAKADWRIKDREGALPLHNSTFLGDVHCTDLLLRADEESKYIDAQDQDKLTPLHQTCFNGFVGCTQRLLEAGASLEATDIDKCTPLHKCAYKGHVDCMRVLFGIPVQKDPSIHTDISETTDTGGDTPVKASDTTEIDISKITLNDALHVTLCNARDVSNATPLHKAAYSGHVECVKLLIQRCNLLGEKDKTGATPLHKAAFEGHESCVKLCLEEGASVEAKDKNGRTPLHYAAYSGHDETCDILVKACEASTAIVDNDKATALHVAAKQGNLDCLIKVLTDENVNEQDSAGDTPLHFGARKQQLEVVQYLCSNVKIDVNRPNAQGRTALHDAVEGGYSDIVRELIMEDADPNLKDVNGVSPLDLANSGSMPAEDVAEYMQERARRRDHEDPETQSRMKRCIALFNSKPKKGVQMLVKEKILANDPKEIAKFLHSNEDLNKQKIGELLGEAELQKVLDAFVDCFDFTGIHFEAALRRFLCTFRLPGEAQKIDRMMEAYAKRFYDQNPDDVFENSDAAYILAFSTIMLNTDAHNPAIKKQNKMTKAQFIGNNRGINNGKDVDQAYMERLYDRIVEEEIKMDATGSMFANAEKKGWMTKQGGRIKTWKRRWFVLSNNHLYYFKTPNDRDPCGIVPLAGLEIQEGAGGRRHSFALQAPKDGQVKAMKMEDGQMITGNHSRYIIACESSRELTEWLTALRSSMDSSTVMDKVQDRMQGGGGDGEPSEGRKSADGKRGKRASKKMKKTDMVQKHESEAEEIPGPEHPSPSATPTDASLLEGEDLADTETAASP